jgi:pilus assembly protein CpaB
MNRTRLMMIGFVALALGAFVSFAVYRNLQSRGGGGQPGMEVIVAADNIPVGAKIEEKDLQIVRYPADNLPPNSPRSRASVLGRGVILPISKGEFILFNKLAGPNAGSGLPALIPPGMRAMSVRVNEVVGVAGFVQPGTRVDVLVTGTPGGSGEEEQTTTVLENVEVIASGQRMERSQAGEAQVAPVITLLVSPDDAQKLTLATTHGRIQLALRNPLDAKPLDLPATRSGTLFKVSAAPPKPVPVRLKPKPVSAKPETPQPSTIQVEVYRGSKKDIKDFDQNDQPVTSPKGKK